MRSKKRLLIAAVLIPFICIVSLVVMAALAISPKGYMRGDVPEAVAHNYLLSLVKKDFSTSYRLLSRDLGNPPDSVEALVDDLERGELLPLYEIQPCVYVENVNAQAHRASVSLRMQYYDPCWRLDTGIPNLSFDFVTISLEEQEDGWKVIGGSDFFERSWIETGAE